MLKAVPSDIHFWDCLETFLCCWYLIIQICFRYKYRSEYAERCFQNIDCAHSPNIAMLWHSHYKVSNSDHQMPLRDLVLRTPLYTIMCSKDLMIPCLLQTRMGVIMLKSVSETLIMLINQPNIGLRLHFNKYKVFVSNR